MGGFSQSHNEMYVYSIYTFFPVSDLIYKHGCNLKKIFFFNHGLTNKHVKMLLRKFGVIQVVSYL